MPRSRSTNQRFRKSSMTSPMLFVWLLASVVAARLGRYPSSDMAARTASRRFSLTFDGFCSTRDTSDGETPALLATS